MYTLPSNSGFVAQARFYTTSVRVSTRGDYACRALL
ncbi:MAG: hypothetical protein RLZZ254_720, partial [Actinomycetota bacterium]